MSEITELVPEFVRIDHHREQRTGVPEIILGDSKTPLQVAAIVRRMTEKQALILASRVDEAKGAFLQKEFPEGKYHPEARNFFLHPGPGGTAGRETNIFLPT